ncbi:hypothetical protein, partial [Loigolactobacillus zhaoyuanensis]
AYSDAFDHKGPLLFYINALGYPTVFGIKLLWIIEIISLFLTLLYIYKTARYFTQSFISHLITLFSGIFIVYVMYLGNLSEEFALPFISFSLYAAISYTLGTNNKKYEWLYFYLFGVSGAAVLFLRANMVSLWVCTMILFIVLALYEHKGRMLISRLLIVSSGVLTIIIPITVYNLIIGTFGDMWYQSFTFNFLYSKEPNPNRFLDVLLDFIHLLNEFGLFFILIIYLVLIIYRFSNLSVRLKRVSVLLITITIFNFLTILISKRPYAHYVATEIPMLAVVTASAISLLFSEKKKNFLQFILATFLLVSISLNGLIDTKRQVSDLAGIGKSPEISNVVSYIKAHSKSTDKIYVHKIDANIYNYSNRDSNSRFFVLPSVNLDHFPKLENEFIVSMKKNSPKLIVTNKNFENQRFDEAYQKKLQVILKQDYKLVKTTDHYQIYSLRLN